MGADRLAANSPAASTRTPPDHRTSVPATCRTSVGTVCVSLCRRSIVLSRYRHSLCNILTDMTKVVAVRGIASQDLVACLNDGIGRSACGKVEFFGRFIGDGRCNNGTANMQPQQDSADSADTAAR